LQEAPELSNNTVAAFLKYSKVADKRNHCCSETISIFSKIAANCDGMSWLSMVFVVCQIELQFSFVDLSNFSETIGNCVKLIQLNNRVAISRNNAVAVKSCYCRQVLKVYY
jgi:hypothetical protein